MDSDEIIEFRKQESLRCSMSRTKSHILNIALSSLRWKWFATYTFSSEVVDRYDYNACAKLFSRFLKKIRQRYPTLQYLVVPELHQDGAFHFHGLFTDELKTSYAGFFKKTGGHTWHSDDYEFGFNSLTPIKNVIACCRYISSYITKDLCAVSKNRRRYWFSISTIEVNKPFRFLMTKEMYDRFCEYYKDRIQWKGACQGGNGKIQYQELWVDADVFDSIFDYVNGYDDDGYFPFDSDDG